MLGSCFQLFFATGVCVSYWVDYAAAKGVSDERSTQWQIPVGLQFVPGAIMGLGMLLVKESVRWLAKKGRNEEALESLVWVRGGEDTPEVRAEFGEILAGVQLEIQQSEGVTWKELILPANRLRMAIAISIQLCQQLTGRLKSTTMLSTADYVRGILLWPTLHRKSSQQLAQAISHCSSPVRRATHSDCRAGFNMNQVALALSRSSAALCFYSSWLMSLGARSPSWVSTTDLLEVASRIFSPASKVSFLGHANFPGGAFAMGSLMLIIAIIVLKFPPKKGANSITPAGAAGIAMVYLEAIAFNMSWGPL